MKTIARFVPIALIALSPGCASVHPTAQAPAVRPATQARLGITLSCRGLLQRQGADTLGGNRKIGKKDRLTAPALLNGGVLARSMGHLYALSRSTIPSQPVVLWLLIQTDGEVSGGCVRKSSGILVFDVDALKTFFREARFRPAQVNGVAIDTWVTMPLSAKVQQVGEPSLAGPTVWVDWNAGVYYCRGDDMYGRTGEGTPMKEDVARDRGYKPARGTPCGG